MSVKAFDYDHSIEKLAQYLKIETVQPNPKYDEAVTFLKNYANELNLPIQQYEPVKGKPIVIISIIGNKYEKSILLNSHIDVVPVERDHWNYEPFNATIHDDKMYARGIQDMKSVGIQYLEAIRMIKPNLKGNYRTVHVSFVPDEEIGGKDGMAIFSKSNDFKKLNVGIGFDEGIASENDIYHVYYAERLVKWIDIKIEGNQGHGSKFIKFTAVSKLSNLMVDMLKFRTEQEEKLVSEHLSIGEVTTLNITKINGGIQTNVIPSCFQMSVDIRVTPDDDDKIDTLIKKWENKYSQTKFKYVTSGTSKCTNLKEGSLTSMFISVLKKRNMKYSELIFTGATDARFLREMNIPVIGFSPMINTPVLLHDNDENLNLNVFKSGIDIYADIIKSLIQIS